MKILGSYFMNFGLNENGELCPDQKEIESIDQGNNGSKYLLPV